MNTADELTFCYRCTGDAMWELLACDIWRDGGSYSATLGTTEGVVSLWLQVSSWDRLEDRSYEALFISDGRDASMKQRRVPSGAKQRQWLATLEREVDAGAVDRHAAGTFAELVAELRIVCSREFDQLPLADAGREAHALELFRLDMSPDEYAARFGHEFAMFSFDDHRYSRPALTLWIQRLADIFFKRHGAPSLRELREKFLTPSEIEAAEQHEKDPF